jgi:hypothetical protein
MDFGRLFGASKPLGSQSVWNFKQTPIVVLIAVSAGRSLTSANVAQLLLSAVGLLLKTRLLA